MEGYVAVFVVIMVLLVGIAIVAGVVSYQAKQRRASEFRQLATGQGWQYIERDDSYARRWEGKPFTGRGIARDVVLGHHHGREFCSFAYTYTTSSYNGTSTTTQSHNFAVFVITVPGQVPAFSVSPEGMFGGKVAEALGFERVNVPDEDFNSTFKVKSDDQQFGLRVLQPSLVQWLKTTGPWQWRLFGNAMISYETGVFESSMLQPRLDLMCDALDRIPADKIGRAHV